MNRKILIGSAVMAIAGVAAWNVDVSSQTKGMTDVMITNIEALANSEGEDEGNDCYKTVSYDSSLGGSYEVKACGKQCKLTKATSHSNSISEWKCY